MVRIWNLPVQMLDRQHLLGEHVETHVIFNSLQRGGGAWFNHPQTKKFLSHIGRLAFRHNQQVAEMKRRGYNHKSPLPAHIEPEPYTIKTSDCLKDFKVLESRNGLNEEFKKYRNQLIADVITGNYRWTKAIIQEER